MGVFRKESGQVTLAEEQIAQEKGVTFSICDALAQFNSITLANPSWGGICWLSCQRLSTITCNLFVTLPIFVSFAA